MLKNDLTNHVFDKWMVIGRSTVKIKHGEKVKWLCKCICGVERFVNGCDLLSKRSKSCGCSRKPIEEVGLNKVYSGFVRNALQRKISFKLTKKQVQDIIKKPCENCGIIGANIAKLRNGKIEFKYNGIDRIDNSLGYVENNVRTYCGECNMIRKNIDDQIWQNWIKRVSEFQRKNT